MLEPGLEARVRGKGHPLTTARLQKKGKKPQKSQHSHARHHLGSTPATELHPWDHKVDTGCHTPPGPPQPYRLLLSGNRCKTPFNLYLTVHVFSGQPLLKSKAECWGPAYSVCYMLFTRRSRRVPIPPGGSESSVPITQRTDQTGTS